MPRAKHPTKHKDNRDFAEIAFDVFRQATGDSKRTSRQPQKNPAAVELGSKGGQARAKKLSATARRRIARKAAAARWKQ